MDYGAQLGSTGTNSTNIFANLSSLYQSSFVREEPHFKTLSFYLKISNLACPREAVQL